MKNNILNSVFMEKSDTVQKLFNNVDNLIHSFVSIYKSLRTHNTKERYTYKMLLNSRRKLKQIAAKISIIYLKIGIYNSKLFTGMF